MPDHSKGNKRVKFYRNFIQSRITDHDVKFGHKVFRLSFCQCLYDLDKKISPKLRISISYLLIYASILSLVLDFFIDVKFLNDLKSGTFR